ncbi:DsrE/DsrF/DrsH-like family protein [Fodinisporobacter ferrooxydans]|uniref:DsrE/DsrF/DrsH-like family protein n=1 Tax=Fodinisporobacter ferrooxydans TaxID=2901836 RepID=A0ABY4CM19_9BACL|nr:DsrE/DsrF/DrsH-like family protein [Alicyclobacillaceae bacterium MYW30-H2]
MAEKRTIYFVTKSENAPIVLFEAIEKSKNEEIMIFFDLDGARVLDEDFAREMTQEMNTDILLLLKSALLSGVKMFACQMNVMLASKLKCFEGVEFAGVVTFLNYAYEADAVLSY